MAVHITFPSISLKQVPGIYLCPYVIQAMVIPVCQNAVTFFLESVQVINHPAAEEGTAIFQGRFINDDFRPLCFDPLHDTLDRALAEIVGVRFHGKTIHTDSHGLFFGRVIFTVAMIVPCQLQHPVGDEIFTGTVGIYDSLDNGFRYIL